MKNQIEDDTREPIDLSEENMRMVRKAQTFLGFCIFFLPIVAIIHFFDMW